MSHVQITRWAHYQRQVAFFIWMSETKCSSVSLEKGTCEGGMNVAPTVVQVRFQFCNNLGSSWLGQSQLSRHLRLDSREGGVSYDNSTTIEVNLNKLELENVEKIMFP